MCDVDCIIISWRHKRRELSYRCQSVENTRLSCKPKNQRWKHLLLRIASDFCCLNMCPAQTHGQWRPWWVDFSHPVYFVFHNWENQLMFYCTLVMDFLVLNIQFLSIIFFLEKTYSSDPYVHLWKRESQWIWSVYLLQGQTCGWYEFITLQDISVKLPIFYTKVIW